ncbi:MAG TPA: lysophospholipid acyltransferase family protein [Candidatus Limnocylindrales bacterium]|nr:lysophospholipid acyltransferase family protein [Candidatus Limnocylindrales bacterium]
MTEAVTAAQRRARGTFVQRLRARAIAAGSWVACRLPERAVAVLAAGAGEAWYRAAPKRAAQARRNLERVVAQLHERGDGATSALVRRAAGDPRALERLVRLAFRHDARYYLDVLRAPSLTPAVFERRVVVETPEAVEATFADARPVIFVSPHLGPIELPALYLAHRSGRTFVAPMETLDDPPLQAWFERTRGSLGVRIVGLREARRALQAALRAGEFVGIVGDRDLAGGGLEVPLFGAPAPLPIGPALLALETGAAIAVVGVRRLADGRIAGRLIPIEIAAEGTRRERIAATLRAEAAAFEDLIADAPEQWSAVFFPIWPDLATEAAS